MELTSTNDLYSQALETMQSYNAELHLIEMKELTQDYLSENQLAQLVGRSKSYFFTQANKSRYTDTFLDRNLKCFEFSKGIQKTPNTGSDYHGFLS
ncbi:DUF3871 family protein [Chryseobacterium gleum]|uniref:DUF3871 family protein n=1 Tax=Chryseobacterium gleum TaxID=250 RepID=UPI0028B1EB21|nr:DUF3871 family protein [Chryseobacterium gleum]